MQKIIIGTANFTGKYGFVAEKKITLDEIKKIIKYAQNIGLNHFDTARSYENVESILGKNLDKSFPLIVDSKINEKDCESIESIILAVKETLLKLGLPKISTMYAHNFEMIKNDSDHKVKKGLEKLLELGFVENLGVSVYTKDELIESKKIFPALDHFQIIENICDRRLLGDKDLEQIVSNGNKINIRSIFLQGILLTNFKDLSDKFQNASKSIKELSEMAEKRKISVVELCLAYAKSITWANKIVIGIDSQLHLQELLQSNYKLGEDWFHEITPFPTDLVDPRYW